MRLKRAICVISVMATLLLLPIEPLRAGLDHPSRLFVNVGAVPLDVYHQQNTANTSGWFPNCSTSKTRRQCMQDALAAFYTDRVRGVRFSFSVYGGWDSTALDSSGNVRSTWRTRLQEFYDDVYDSGMRNVVVTPRLEPVTSSDGVVQVTELDSCTGTNKTYWYGKISPVPYQDFGWPVNSGGNNTGSRRCRAAIRLIASCGIPTVTVLSVSSGQVRWTGRTL